MMPRRYPTMVKVARFVVVVLLTALLTGPVPGNAAQEGTPAPAATTDASEETLFSWTIPAEALPTGDVEAVSYRLMLPADVSLPLLAGPFCG
jgi:hypothetical protein